MAGKKSGLGRGLDSLFAESSENIVGSSSPSMLHINEIEPDKSQPRKNFTEESLAELAASISQHGVLQPLVVRPNPTGGYKLIAGERRWRACRIAGVTEVPAIIKDATDEEAMEIALIENLQREDLDPVEEALGYEQLIERCGYTQEQAAERLGKSRSSVTNSLRLLALEPGVRNMLHSGVITTGHAKVLLGLESSDMQHRAAESIVKYGLTVRETEQLCKKLKKPGKPRAEKPRPALPSEVEIALREVLGTEVKVDYKDGRGQLHLAYYSDDQLRAFANILGRYQKEQTAAPQMEIPPVE